MSFNRAWSLKIARIKSKYRQFRGWEDSLGRESNFEEVCCKLNWNRKLAKRMNFGYREGEWVSDLWTNEEKCSFANSNIWNEKNQISWTQNVMEKNDYCDDMHLMDFSIFGYFGMWKKLWSQPEYRELQYLSWVSEWASEWGFNGPLAQRWLCSAKKIWRVRGGWCYRYKN